MSEPMPLLQQRGAREQRLPPVAHVAPYVLLVILVIFTVMLKRSAGSLLFNRGLLIPGTPERPR